MKPNRLTTAQTIALVDWCRNRPRGGDFRPWSVRAAEASEAIGARVTAGNLQGVWDQARAVLFTGRRVPGPVNVAMGIW